jgi:hypothetical protein
LTRTIAGGGWFYRLTIASILIVLTCSANTSFADFPRVCRALAVDGYLPQSFANRGRRLVYSEGIVVLTILSAILLWAFGGITDRLIPLFAVGAFMAFTLSQAGMVMHWKRMKEPGARRKKIINAVGALTTGSTTVIIAVAKFAEGAWVSLLLFISLVRLMSAVKRHYDVLERQLQAPSPIIDCHVPAPIVVVPLENWNRVTRKAMLFAFSISTDVRVVHVRTGEELQSGQADEKEVEKLAKLWQEELKRSAAEADCPAPKVTTLSSPYRLVVEPIIKYVLELERRHPDRSIAVVIPELVEPRWYYYFLHNQRGRLLAARLLVEGDRRIVVVNVPWYLKES